MTFLISAAGHADLPLGDTGEVAIAGRSNSGKSSFLNRLAGHRQLARVSKTPGRTQLLNFFDVSGGGRIVDLPGYGYAKAQRQAQARWQREVNSSLSHRDCLEGVVLVMDIRHPFQGYDMELIDWSSASEMPLHILLNKADKLKSGARKQALLQARRSMPAVNFVTVQAYSALTGLGQAEAIATIVRLLGQSSSLLT
jgi:GTP-binding protein